MVNFSSFCKSSITQNSKLLTYEFSHSIVSIVALIYYLRSAWTNPGYLIGSAADEARKAGAYDPKLYAVDGLEGDKTVDISAAGQYNGGDFS